MLLAIAVTSIAAHGTCHGSRHVPRLPRRAVLQTSAAAAAAAAAATTQPLPALAVAYRDQPFSTPAAPGRTKAKCRDLESCQAEGERRAAEAEAKAGPVRHVGPLGANGLGRVRYRAMKETEDGPPLRPG